MARIYSFNTIERLTVIIDCILINLFRSCNFKNKISFCIEMSDIHVDTLFRSCNFMGNKIINNGMVPPSRSPAAASKLKRSYHGQQVLSPSLSAAAHTYTAPVAVSLHDQRHTWENSAQRLLGVMKFRDGTL